MTTSSVSQLFRKHIGHHTDIKSQLEKIADKKSNQLTCAEKLAVFDDLTMKLDAHADYEENVFFPLVKSIADDQDAKQLIRIGFETHAKWRMMYNTIKNKAVKTNDFPQADFEEFYKQVCAEFQSQVCFACAIFRGTETIHFVKLVPLLSKTDIHELINAGCDPIQEKGAVSLQA